MAKVNSAKEEFGFCNVWTIDDKICYLAEGFRIAVNVGGTTITIPPLELVFSPLDRNGKDFSIKMCTVTSEPTQSSSRRVSSFKDLSVLLTTEW